MAVTLEFEPADLDALREPLVLLDTPAKRLVAPNRIAYQPMEANDAEEDGSPSPLTALRYVERAHGRAGIDFVEAIACGHQGKARGRQLVLTEETKEGFLALVERYREANAETPLVFQLTHSGRSAESPVSPCPLPDGGARLLTDEDMARIGDDLVRATRLAADCGADGIDFKHCHGYLFGSLLGPANRARPGWTYGGDTLEERTRFFREMMSRMTEEAPSSRFLYMVRLSAVEGTPGGFGSLGPETAEEDPDHAELREFVRMMVEAGVRLVNQSAGIPGVTTDMVRQTNDAPDGFFDHQRYAAIIRGEAGVPVVGSGYSYPRSGRNKLPGEPREKNIVTLGGRAVREGRADLIGIGRQSLADPYFARRLLEGEHDRIRWDTSCNRCAIAMRSDIPAACATHDPEGIRRFRELRKNQPPPG